MKITGTFDGFIPIPEQDIDICANAGGCPIPANTVFNVSDVIPLPSIASGGSATLQVVGYNGDNKTSELFCLSGSENIS